MKINVASIVRDHWATLHNAGSNSTSWADILLFYGLPGLSGVVAYAISLTIKSDSYNVSITFFGIFVALLLNIQVAIFGIFQRKWDIPSDKRQAEIQREQLDARRKLLSELNTNISYLTVVSSVALVIFLIFFVGEIKGSFGAAITTSVYCHFILTFLMVIKRAYALFQKEYSGP